jgi:hypothetical protein
MIVHIHIIPSMSTIGSDFSPIAQNGDSLDGSSLADPLFSSTWKFEANTQVKPPDCF